MCIRDRLKETELKVDALPLLNGRNFLLTGSYILLFAFPCRNKADGAIGSPERFFHIGVHGCPFTVLVLILKVLYVVKNLLFGFINGYFFFDRIFFFDK